MQKLPDEIINKIFLYMSTPTATIMKPYIKSYETYCQWIPPALGRMGFEEYMMVNAMYLDHTSKRHIRERKFILQLIIK
jgi:hypothetical protein